MKRWILSTHNTSIFRVCLAALLCLSTFGLLTVDVQAGTSGGGSYVPDANLRDAINDALGFPHSHNVVPADLETLTYLYAGGYGIVDLDGLQYATNLDRLSLQHNQISNLIPLQHLANLKKLELSNTNFTDFYNLSYMTNLSELGLGGNNISDISFLEDLNSLSRLGLSQNNISNLNVLEDKEYLTYLNLEDNNVSNIEPLRGLPRLKEIDLINNQVSSIAALEDVPALETLWLYFNDVTSIEPLENSTNLCYLWADFNDISNIEPIAGSTSLIGASFARNQIEHIHDLSGMTSLQRLDLFGNDITGFGVDTEFPDHLTYLNLSSNPLGTFDYMYGIGALNLDSLEWLGLANCGLSSCFDSDEFPNLQELYLSGNQLDSSDLFALVGGTSGPIEPLPIKILDVSDNQIDDIFRLYDWPDMDSGDVLNVSKNFLDLTPGSDDMSYIDLLQDRGVSVTWDPQKIILGLPDANLEAAILAALHRYAGYMLTSDFNALTTLYANNAGIIDLTGLEKFPNLQTLSLGNNSISDISPLTSLAKLKYLFLNDNDITGISPLSGLTQLNSMTLAGNNISSITDLSALTKLSFLYLDNNQISQISALSGMTKLVYLGLSFNTIGDISVLANMTSLYAAYLDSNDISEFSALSTLSTLQELKLSDNDISDLSPLGTMPNLRYLELDANPITDISYIAGLSNLSILRLCSDNIADDDLSYLTGLSYLSELYLNNNQITDISQLADMDNVYYLEITHNFLDITSGSDDMDIIAQYISRGATVLYYPQQTALVSLAIDPSGVTSLSEGAQLALTAIGTYSDGSQGDLSTQVTWESFDNAIAWVDEKGVVTGITAGNTIITASLSGITSLGLIINVIPAVHLTMHIPGHDAPMGPDDSPSGALDLLTMIPAQSDVTFAEGVWKIVIYSDYYQEDYLDVIHITIGEYDPELGIFVEGSLHQFLPASQSSSMYPLEFDLFRESFTVHEGNYLGISITKGGNQDFLIYGSEDNYLTPPSGSMDYPLPEMATGILLGLGIAGLTVFTIIKSRRRTRAGFKA
jgi:internalin A